MANEFIARKGLIVLSSGAIITGSVGVLGPVSASGGFSGSGENVFGVVTSSFALANLNNASISGNTITFTRGNGTTFNVEVSQTGSVASSSFASFATSASYSERSTSGSYASNSFLATSASFSTRTISGSYAINSLFASSATSASFSDRTISGSYAVNSFFATSASFSGRTISASNALQATSASFVDFVNVGSKPTLVSSSLQFNNASSPFTGSFSGSFFGNGSGLTGMASSLGISGSSGTDTINLLTETLTIAGGNGITTAVTANTVTITAPAGTVSASGQILHNSTSGYVANEHIDHTSVTITAGTGLSGGGTIAATRTLDVGAGLGIIANADNVELATGSAHFTDGVLGRLNAVGVYSSSGQVSHTATSGYVANEHINHTTVSITAGAGLTGGGDISTTRTVDVGAGLGIIANADNVELSTGSAHFTSGVLGRLNAVGVYSSSGQVQLSGITGTTFATANYTFPQNLTVLGTITAQEFNTEFVSASIIYESGSTQFGNSSDDVHTFTGTVKVTGSLATSNGVTLNGGAIVHGVLYSSGSNPAVDIGTEVVAQVAVASYDAAFFDYVIKKSPNFRAGTVIAVWDGASVEYTDVSTADIGNTSGVVMSVDISAGQARLKATVDSNSWVIKSSVRAV